MIDLILLEDEPILARELSEFLGESGYRVTPANSLASFAEAFDEQRHHLAVIDLGLPDGDGLDLIQQLRERGSTLGIVAFTARGSTDHRVTGFRVGADHYLAKGCDLEELTAVLEALRRRLGLQRGGTRWELELASRQLRTPNQQRLRLSHQDMLVLQCLMQRAGDIVSRREIVHALDEDYMTYDQRRLDTQIRRLRRNVEQAAGLELPLKTLRNTGYCFYEKVRIVA
ncbi:response regulator transcription factor [Pseudomonas sp. No.21]|uniref:response regulator transcription factor n=1 Tax=Pseudomonas TaxID=286 RepID=UPI000DA8D9A3|nr:MULTISPECIES: response regulator transcription factor [Pseudomonas]MDW3716344.1 response regulator transcription factor [Pseudomonas sp. 2023EL-01195]PZE12166.1 DNA-binding response regulator [Pseudomonas sp. 57B-090624]GJN47680.1 DNA-binding response regulator [Pseudomonas tohonis]